MQYGIVVDSGCDEDKITQVSLEDVGFDKVPLKIEVGTQEFSDGVGFDADPMLAALDSYRGKTSTAAPSPGEWLDAFTKYDQVFALTITSALSGSHAGATVAKQMALEKQPGKSIEILDSLSTGPEMTLIARKLGEYFAEKLDFTEICQRIHAYMARTKLLFVLESVDNLTNNGRVSRLEAAMMKTLNIRLLGRASDKGLLDVFQKARGKMKIFQNAVETMLTDGYCGGKVIISHCHNPEMADFVKDKLAEKYHDAEIVIMRSKGLNSYYAEKGGILIGFETGSAQFA